MCTSSADNRSSEERLLRLTSLTKVNAASSDIIRTNFVGSFVFCLATIEYFILSQFLPRQVMLMWGTKMVCFLKMSMLMWGTRMVRFLKLSVSYSSISSIDTYPLIFCSLSFSCWPVLADFIITSLIWWSYDFPDPHLCISIPFVFDIRYSGSYPASPGLAAMV
jgi:hypothetical protein